MARLVQAKRNLTRRDRKGAVLLQGGAFRCPCADNASFQIETSLCYLPVMRTTPAPELARVASMIGEPARAAMLQALALVVSPAATDASVATAPNGSMRFARTCYDHLAGILGVCITDRLVAQGFVVGRDVYELTPAGDRWLGSLGVDVSAVRRSRRTFARPCIDWTERRPHLAGAVGAAIATVCFDQRWIAPVNGTRAVRLTLRGREALSRTLGIEVPHA